MQQGSAFDHKRYSLGTIRKDNMAGPSVLVIHDSVVYDVALYLDNAPHLRDAADAWSSDGEDVYPVNGAGSESEYGGSDEMEYEEEGGGDVAPQALLDGIRETARTDPYRAGRSWAALCPEEEWIKWKVGVVVDGPAGAGSTNGDEAVHGFRTSATEARDGQQGHHHASAVHAVGGTIDPAPPATVHRPSGSPTPPPASNGADAKVELQRIRREWALVSSSLARLERAMSDGYHAAIEAEQDVLAAQRVHGLAVNNAHGRWQTLRSTKAQHDRLRERQQHLAALEGIMMRRGASV